MKEQHISMASLMIFLHCWKAHHRVSMTEAAEIGRVSTAGATCAVDRLEELKWITRTYDKNDRRKRYIEVTEFGKREGERYCRDLMELMPSKVFEPRQVGGRIGRIGGVL